VRLKIKSKVEYELVYLESFKDAETLGECRFDAKQIAIKKGQSSLQEKKTLIHEILHAVCFERDIKIPHESIYKLESALIYLLSRNDLGGMIDEKARRKKK
jgi:hypothetical protein